MVGAVFGVATMSCAAGVVGEVGMAGVEGVEGMAESQREGCCNGTMSGTKPEACICERSDSDGIGSNGCVSCLHADGGAAVVSSKGKGGVIFSFFVGILGLSQSRARARLRFDDGFLRRTLCSFSVRGIGNMSPSLATKFKGRRCTQGANTQRPHWLILEYCSYNGANALERCS